MKISKKEAYGSLPDTAEAALILDDEKLIDDDDKKFERWVIWCAWLFLGCFNNFGYVVVLSAAKSLADHFNQSKLIGVEAWALIGFGIFFKVINARYLEGVSHRLRGWIAAVGFFSGYCLLALSVFINFWFAIFAICIIGSSKAFGESVMLGYIRQFDSKLGSTAWSSGTGLAGLAGSGVYLLLESVFGMSNVQKFLVMTPTAIFYVIAFEITWRSSLRNKEEDAGADDDIIDIVGKGSIDFGPMLEAECERKRSLLPAIAVGSDIGEPLDDDVFHDGISMLEDGTPVVDEEIPFSTRLKEVWRLAYFRCVCLSLVYFFEYVCSVGLAQIANTTSSHTHIQDKRYAILALCYQCGVFVSRSSLTVVNLSARPFIFAMTAFQALNFVIWHFHVEMDIFEPPAVQYAMMVFVGLLGGCMYVNTVFSIMSDEALLKHRYGNLKELAVNIMTICVTFGVASSALYDIIMAYSFFEHENKLSSD